MNWSFAIISAKLDRHNEPFATQTKYFFGEGEMFYAADYETRFKALDAELEGITGIGQSVETGAMSDDDSSSD